MGHLKILKGPQICPLAIGWPYPWLKPSTPGIFVSASKSGKHILYIDKSCIYKTVFQTKNESFVVKKSPIFYVYI